MIISQEWAMPSLMPSLHEKELSPKDVDLLQHDRITLLKELLKSPQPQTPLAGYNEAGETIVVGVNHLDDNQPTLANSELVMTTYQSNHWVRNDYFDNTGKLNSTEYNEHWVDFKDNLN